VKVIKKIAQNDDNSNTNSISNSTYPWCGSPDIIVWNYTISACNVWSINASTYKEWYWKYFQWWNNYWANYEYNSSIWTTRDRVDASWYWPGNYFSKEWFIELNFDKDWSTVRNDNLWWDTTNTNEARQWPCASGYHVPTKDEWVWILNAWWWWTWEKDMNDILKMLNALKLPMAWGRGSSDGGNSSNVANWYYWTSSSNGELSYMLLIEQKVSPIYKIDILPVLRGWGLPVRCFKNVINKVENNKVLNKSQTESKDKIINSWMDIDKNCNISDLKIGTQTWAWCNSTLWSGQEWWKKTDWTDWIINSCFDYSWNKINWCEIWNKLMSSNSKANDWFNSTNINWDKEYNTIWWKLYTRNNAKTACKSWRHVPSNEEFQELEKNLNWSKCRYGWFEKGYCDGFWWNLHETVWEKNSLANFLKVPLSWVFEEDWIKYSLRWHSAGIWTNSYNQNNDDGYYMEFVWSYYTARLGFSSKNIWRSVHCIKD